MNMHATVEIQPTEGDVIHSIGELLTVALHMLDELDVPADVGAHLDFTIQKLATVRTGPANMASAATCD